MTAMSVSSPFDQAERQWQASRPSLAVGGPLTPTEPRRPAVVARLAPPYGRTRMKHDMPFQIRIDNLLGASTQALIAEHLAGMQGNSPPGHVNALAIDGLRAGNVTFWTAWDEEDLCGCGALKELSADAGEVKSMRTRAAFLGRGVGQALLDHIVRTAHERGYRRLLLETGTGDAFKAAHGLYLKNGFKWCGAFGAYTTTDFNVFMERTLR